jgi:methylase of polypeptide subunit release factors
VEGGDVADAGDPISRACIPGGDVLLLLLSIAKSLAISPRPVRETCTGEGTVAVGSMGVEEGAIDI